MTSSCAMLVLILALLGAAMAAAAGGGDVVSYSYPAFDAATTRDGSLFAGTNLSVLTSARLLFEQDQFFSEFNASEGFLLLSDEVDVWCGGAGAPAREASFNTSFTVGAGASPDPVAVAFVLLLDRYPTLNDPAGLRGKNVSAADGGGGDGNATNSLVAVQVGTVMSYVRDSPNVGLNVTVTPNRTAAPSGGSTVWIQYRAVEHRLSVHVAAAGEPRPARALLDVPLRLAGDRTTQTALVGFFAAEIRDIIVGVRDWELTVERLHRDGGGKKSTSWLAILLAVLGSVTGTAAMVSVVVFCFVIKRRRRDMEPKQ
ncbi:uncharacterized protein LOC102719628 [Oryza brachyantha]|uniref:Legume lectin domain-containing protein n=1 Tax=Oryza brachyantha TaxID=4533 RepID=J3N917_ORYBR|nr:uncharacterized protein LOC102719628 [Oryza brachyantha]